MTENFTGSAGATACPPAVALVRAGREAVAVAEAIEANTARLNTRTACVPNRDSYPFGAPLCRIYRPSPSVMQAGRGRRARTWALEFELAGTRSIEPLMGWTASDDPFAQIRLTFPTLSAAVDYAEREGIDYVVIEPSEQRPVRKAFVAPGHGLNDDRQNVKQTEQKEKQP